jgi:hypothetical protein
MPDGFRAHPPTDIPDVLTGTMTRSEVLEVLQGLRFRSKHLATLELDRDVRDFLANAIKPQRRNAA